jgi:endonuclease G
MKSLLIILSFLFAACTSGGAQPSGDNQQSSGIEIPSYTTTEDVVSHTGYTASYNHTTLCPNWVAWELTASEGDGTLGGQYSFSRDPDVSFPKASREDYSHSGWDKGHMAPRADMRWSEKALEESYYFTNICPQDHTMNSQAWRKIEEMTRRVAKHYGAVWIVCGPIYRSAEADRNTLGAGGVQVPDAFFKAMAVQTTDSTYATVGFLVENRPETRSPRHYAVSVDSIEHTAGRVCFPKIENSDKQSFDWNIWNF